MYYNGRFETFDSNAISTYPISERTNKVTLDDLVNIDEITSAAADMSSPFVTEIASAILEARSNKRPVILFTGAHLIKNGLGPIVVDMIRRELVTLVAGNGATCIHDFELAMIGATSEYVPNALNKGQFGMAAEFALYNGAISAGSEMGLGLGESLGRMICDNDFRDTVYDRVGNDIKRHHFAHSDISILASCFTKGIPFTAHVGIGTDVTDQHASFDGAAKGGCSGTDFMIYTSEVSRLVKGGVVLNIGSAVTGPEVLLKAVSMSANIGNVPRNLITADFDIRAFRTEDVGDESREGYYYRDQKSVVTRVPEAFGGKGYYVEGNQRVTVPDLYRTLISLSADES